MFNVGEGKLKAITDLRQNKSIIICKQRQVELF